MLQRRTALLTGLSLIAATRVSAQVSAPDRADLTRIEGYLNSIRALKARFTQVAPDGGISRGEAWLLRPGRMRFQYDPPSPFLLVANYGTLYFHDSQLAQTTNIPLNRTPLGILLADQTRLSGDVSVTKFVRLPGQLQVSLVRAASPGEGSLTLVFADNPMTLKQWIVVDQQAKETRVSLTNLEVGARIDPKLFENRATDGTPGGG